MWVKRSRTSPRIFTVVRSVTKSYYEVAVSTAVSDVVSDLDTAVDLESLAARAATSPFHFHRIFRGMVGETPLGLRRRLLMERAAWRLSRTDRSILEIALGAGFETHEAFTRAFRRAFSATPSEYRNRYEPRIQLAAICGLHYEHDGIDPSGVILAKGESEMDIEIVDRPELRLGTVRHVGPYNRVTEAFERLGEVEGVSELFQDPGVAMLAIYHDDPESTPQDELRADAAVVVPESTPMPEGLVEQRIPGGTFARYEHIGPYEELGDVWARLLGQWLPDSGYSIGPGGTYEIYRNDMREVPAEELRTDLYVAVEPTRAT
jgi:AraC family transcriptional regulator